MLISIETSCDESAVSIIDIDKFLAGADVESYLRADLITSQVKLHQPYGGVVPELAAREHTRNLPLLVNEALVAGGIGIEKLRAVAVTRGPGLKGCLLVGLTFAKGLAFSRSLPLIAVNHLEGHIFAGELLPAAERPEWPFIALLVSGGHTQLVLVKDFRSYELIAETRDDAAGEAFDKVATLLGLPYPGGPELAKCAVEGDKNSFNFPIALPEDLSSFSFSGLKTSVSRQVQALAAKRLERIDVCNIAAAVESTIVETLVSKTVKAAGVHNVKSVLLTGGVAANLLLRETLAARLAAKRIALSVPPRKWCTDNAAMIGVLAARIIEREPKRYLSSPAAAESLADTCRARWPLSELSSGAA